MWMIEDETNLNRILIPSNEKKLIILLLVSLATGNRYFNMSLTFWKDMNDDLNKYEIGANYALTPLK